MSKADQAAQQARRLFNTRCNGVLSTHSVDLPGYPFGSITPYCLNREGEAVILISSIAQHTRNILANEKVSLIAFDDQADDSQAAERITYIGNAIAIDDDAMAERYYRFYPKSRHYHRTHDFNFYKIEFVSVRYIGGFGEIYWLDKTDFLKPNPFSFEAEAGMIAHMNTDHQDAINHYCAVFNIGYETSQLPSLAAIDSEGFYLRVAGRLHRLPFDHAVHSAMEVRQAFVDLASRPI